MRFYATDQEAIARLFLHPSNLLDGNYGCFFTSGFIHQDGSHLFFNMLGIFIFSNIVERKLGFFKTMFIYLGALSISMLFSTVVYTFFLHKNVAIIGASGALMGLISAAMLLDPLRITYEMLIPIPVMIKGWIFFYIDIKGLLNGEIDGVSHLAHLCGFLSVAILVYFLSKKDQKIMAAGLITNIASFFLFVFLGNLLLSTI